MPYIDLKVRIHLDATPTPAEALKLAVNVGEAIHERYTKTGLSPAVYGEGANVCQLEVFERNALVFAF